MFSTFRLNSEESWTRIARLACFWLMLGVLFVVSAPTVQADDGLDEYNLAVGLYKQNRWSLAADSFRKFLKEHPKHVKAPYGQLYLGLTLVNLEEYDDARTVLRTYVKDYPNSQNLADAMYRVGECSYLLDDLKSAEKEFGAFVQKWPKHALGEWAYPYLAEVELRLGQPKVAATHFASALELFPNGRLAEDSKFGLARAQQANGDVADAKKGYEELAANRGGSRAAEAQLNLGTIYFDGGEFASAATAYADLPKRFPESQLVPVAQLNAGYAYYQLEKYADAISAFTEAAMAEPQTVTANYWIGLSYKATGDYANAVTVLQKTFDAHQDQPISPDILYQLADAQLRSGQLEKAKQRFLDVTKRWPEHGLADDALLFAAETALLEAGSQSGETQTARLNEADTIIARLGKEYPRSGLFLSEKLVAGRILLMRGGDDKLKQAASDFEEVVKDSKVAATQSRARFYLARTYQSLGDDAAVLKALEPLVKEVRLEGAGSEYLGALVMQGNSFLAQKDYANARGAASDYLRLAPKGEFADQALSTRAIASAQLNQKEAAQADIDLLSKDFPNSVLLPSTLHQLAEYVYSKQDWQWSADLFQRLEKLTRTTADHPVALSGLAWSLFQQKKYAESAELFSKVVKDSPKHALAAEAAFKAGDAEERAGRLEQAAAAYRLGFMQYTDTQYGYLAGLQAARVLGRLKKTEEADAAYDALLKAHPKPDDLDKLLNEWALLNYEAEAYSRADEIFAMLVAKTPESDLADDARYSLAESDLVAGRLDKAKEVFKQLTDDKRSDAEIKQDSLYRLVAISAEQSDWKSVLAESQRLLKDFPEGRYRWDADFYAAQAQLQLENAQVAFDSFTRLKSEKSNEAVSAAMWFPDVWVLLAESAFRLKKYDVVVSTVTEFEAWDADNPLLYKAYEVLGRTYKQQAEFPKARAAFEKVIGSEEGRRTETAAKSQLLLADTYFLEKNYRAALKEFLAVYVLYKFPEYQAPALFQAAVCHELLNEWSQSAKTYEDLIKEFPDSDKAKEAAPRLKVAKAKANGS